MTSIFHRSQCFIHIHIKVIISSLNSNKYMNLVIKKPQKMFNIVQGENNEETTKSLDSYPSLSMSRNIYIFIFLNIICFSEIFYYISNNASPPKCVIIPRSFAHIFLSRTHTSWLFIYVCQNNQKTSEMKNEFSLLHF